MVIIIVGGGEAMKWIHKRLLEIEFFLFVLFCLFICLFEKQLTCF
jgi:hypothetical protein